MSEPYAPPTAPPPPGGPATYGKPGLPWDREKTGNALVDTAKSLITAPGRAYAEMREKGDYASPLLWVVIFGTLGSVIGLIWNLLFGSAMASWFATYAPPEFGPGFAQAFEPSVLAAVVSIVFAPVISLVVLFVLAAIFHLFLLLVGGTKDSTAGFEGTVRALGYGWVAHVAQLIPILGSFWFLWTFVLTIIGLGRVHHTSGGRAAAALLLPFLLCCLCAVGGVLAAGGLGALAAMGANQ